MQLVPTCVILKVRPKSVVINPATAGLCNTLGWVVQVAQVSSHVGLTLIVIINIGITITITVNDGLSPALGALQQWLPVVCIITIILT